MDYSITIIEVGPDASDFLAEQTATIFAGNAPGELRSYCFVTDKSELTSPLVTGQPALTGDQEWRITATGDAAERNLDALGHITLVFDGASKPRLPGALYLSGSYPESVLTASTRLVIGNA